MRSESIKMPNVKLPGLIGGEYDLDRIRQNLSHTSKLDSTAEDWEELTVTKTQCKKEYTLARGGLIRQFIDCCLETNTSSP